MHNITVAALAAKLDARCEGEADLPITHIAEPSEASGTALALAMDPRYHEALRHSSAKIAVLGEGVDWKSLGLRAAIFAPRPRYVLSGVTAAFAHPHGVAPGVHPTALIAPSAKIGPNAAVGPYVIIEEDVEIGANAVISAQSFIGRGARIGASPFLAARAYIGARVTIGDHVIIQPGAVIGADGFSFVTPTPGTVEDAKSTGRIGADHHDMRYARIHSLGAVRLGDHVEIGANATLDRGTIADTTIGSGTKLDNQVHIGHNVQIGETCLLCGQVGVAGSTRVGDRVVLGGQVGVADHITIGSDVVVAGKSAISSHVPSGRVMMGNPAMKMELNVESYKAIRRLPRVIAKLNALEKLVSKMGKSG